MKENNELKEVIINEWIWVVFLILSLLNIYGDELEKKTLKENEKHNEKARKLFLVTASVALIIYLYFVITSYNKLQKAKNEKKNTQLREINFLGQSLIFIGACLLIYFNIKNKNETTTELI